VADESVVVMKSRPVKTGNRLEDKTGMIHGLFVGAVRSQKPCRNAKGGSSFEGSRNKKGHESGHKPSDGAGHFSAETCNRRSAVTGRSPEYPGKLLIHCPQGIEDDGNWAKNRKSK
jgi:hypothetical protein